MTQPRVNGRRTALSSRGTSAEVINATLLEIFLTLVFLVFSIAVFEQRKAIDATNRAKRAEATMDQTKANKTQLGDLQDSLAHMGTRLDSLKFTSREPTQCEKVPGAPDMLSVVFIGERLRVTVTNAHLGLLAGYLGELTPLEFERRFEAIARDAHTRFCFYRVTVRDTHATTKEQYKRSLRAIYSAFRPRQFLN